MGVVKYDNLRRGSTANICETLGLERRALNPLELERRLADSITVHGDGDWLRHMSIEIEELKLQ
jgi:hypothetical protein